MDKKPVNIDLLFETSWKCAIKSVVFIYGSSTKAKTLQNLYKDKNIFIGPDVWTEDTLTLFHPSRTVLKEWKAQAKLPLRHPGEMRALERRDARLLVLVKFDGLYQEKDLLLRTYVGPLWRRFLHAYGDYDEACALLPRSRDCD